MTNHNAMKLLGLIAIFMIPMGMAFAVITPASGVTVTAPAQPNVNSVNVSWTSASTDDEPTDGALTGHYVEISDNGFTNIIESVFIAAPTVSTSFNSLQPNTTYDVRVIANFATAGNQTAVAGSGSTNPDITDPVVTGSVTNVNDGGLTELTATDQYAESCTSTDNDVFFVDNCAVALGGIDTSVLGLQSVTYEATDASTNTGSDTVSTTIQDTTAPVISDPVPGQSGIKGILFTDNEAGVSATDLTAVTISAELFAPNATSMQTVPDISGGTISFTPDVTGSWSIVYTATDTSANTDSVSKTVTVTLGDSPVITLTGSSPQTILLHNAYVEQGATASDTEDGDLTGSIVIDASAVDVDTLGSYIVTYDVTDSSGNTDHEERIVNVVTGDSPVITILGNNPETVNLHDPYADAGATASDTEDGDLTGSIITTGTVDVDTLGSYIISYDVTDSNGNTAHAERTVNVVTGNVPVITIVGANPLDVRFSTSYTESGATASDIEDGDITGSIVVSGAVNTFKAGSYIISYDVTDSNGNTAHAERTVTVGAKSVSHRCDGDCVPPTIGLDSDGRRMVEWPVMYKTSTVSFRQLAEYFHTPMSDFTVNVGDTNTLKFVIYENSGYDAIRQIGLSIGVPLSGTFNDGAAQLRWFAAPLGQTVGDNTSYIEETDKNNVFELKSFTTERLECNPATVGNNNCMGVTLKYIFREAPKDTAVRLDIWDDRRNAFQHVLNHGVTVIGASLNGPDIFQAMANDGKMYTLTTENDYATDQNGDRWSLVDSFWTKDLKPVVNESAEQRIFDLEKAESRAKQTFDSAPFQKEPKPVKTTEYPDYPRLHDSVPNMNKALIDYVLSRANHS